MNKLTEIRVFCIWPGTNKNETRNSPMVNILMKENKTHKIKY